MGERRYFGLDALRGSMMMLGIVLHAAMLYLAAPPATMPIPTDRNNAPVFDHVFSLIHSFRMPTFFLLAGFFTSLLVEKRGLWGTYRNRAGRVLAPLLVGIVTILPITGLLMFDFMLSARYGTHDLVPDREAMLALGRELQAKGVNVNEISFGHLWFLYYLCMLYVMIPALRAMVAWSARYEKSLRTWLGSPLAVVAFALFTAASLWPFRGGQVHEGFIYLTPHLPSLVYYGSFFAFGYAIHVHGAFLEARARDFRLWGALAMILFPLATYASHADNGAAGASFALHLGAVLANGMLTWALIGMFVGLAQCHFDRDTPWIQYVSQSSYWVYLVHLPLVFFAGWVLVRFDLPAVLKFPLVCGFAAGAGLVTFHYWVQKTWVGVFLHGRRLDLKWPWSERRNVAR